MRSILILYLMLFGCASSTVKFRSKDPVQVRLVEPGGQVSDEILGTTPFSVPSERVFGRILSAQANRRESQTWYFVPTDAHDIEVTFHLERDEDSLEKDREKDRAREREQERQKEANSAKTESIVQKNKFLRLVLASYQALSQDLYEDALRLAQEAALQQTELAAPEILKGLALIKLKKFELAKQAFKRAKILDPGDPNIDVLLNSFQEP